MNETACNPAGTAVIVCGDYNADGCLEWGTPAYCQVYQACQGGVCVQQPAPAKVLINEVLYNSVGPDIDVFVELKGPPGQSLAGYSLVGVNGNGTGDYNIISLGGTIPGSGFFVVSHPEAMPSISDMAQQFSDKVDYENGPDNIQLRYGSLTVDAVGYGTFGGGAVFAGEGSPAPGVAAGSSLGRDASSEDTDNNAADFYEYTSPTPGKANVMSNLAPQAALQCPTSGLTGQELLFDGTASMDPDGTIVLYVFNFGDGSPQVSGNQSSVQRSYAAAGSYTVTLTIEDNQGATDVATCSLSVGDENVPEVTIIKPMNNKQVTQGDVVQVLVNATAAPGRSISQVQLLAAGVPYGAADTQAPYEFFYTVPESQPTNSVLSLQAKATDSAGSQGYSPIAALQVKNDPPVASFTAVVSGALQVSVDAGGCFDTETPVELLEVRWDFQNDGVWDTDWSTTKLAQHPYPADGTYTIKMAVRDEAGQVSQTTRQITLSSIQYVAGDVTTTTWTGTIVITGDVTVPSGHTLTVSPDTSVLFSWNDQNQDGVGDWGILVHGTLLVKGTPAKPVIFTSLGTSHKHSKAWDRIDLRGSGHNIAYAIIEYADVGLSVAGGGAVSDSTVRFSKTGVLVNSGGAFTFDRCTISGNDTNGFEMSAGAATVNFSSLLSNGHTGAYVRAGTFNLYDSEVNGNGTVGIRFYTSGTGDIRRNLITGSALEGVRIETNGSTDPNPTIHYNNIVGNALVGARIQQNVTMTASVTGQYTTNNAGPWSTPGGETIDFLRYSYSEGDSSSNYYSGSILQGSTTLMTKTTSDSGWLNLLGQGVTSASARVQSNSSSSSYYGIMDVTTAVYDRAGAVREMSVITRTQRLDARHNYFGVFPDVLEVITVAPLDRVNVEGFVGQAFDDTWSKGNYYGGETIDTNLTWFGDVIITGQLDVTTGATLTVAAGVTVKFGCVDANGNGVGDCDIEVLNSTLVINGTQDQPVVFTDYRSLKSAGSWHRLRCAGPGGLQATHTIFEYAQIGLYLETGTHSLGRVTTRSNALHGVHLKSATSVAATGLISRNNGGNGVHIESSSGVSLNKAPGQVLQLKDNAGHGLYASASTNNLTLSNCTVSGNDGAGLFFTGSSVSVDHCTVQQNQYGAWYEGSSVGSMTACDVKFNDREGIFLSTKTTNPNPAIQGNNIYGTSVIEAGVLHDPSLSATVTGQYTTKTEGPWTTPNGSMILFMQIHYTEGDSSSNYYSGSILPTTSSSTTVLTANTPTGPRFVDIRGYETPSLAARVQSNSSSASYYGTMAVPWVFYYADSTAGQVKELAALTDSGTVSCTGNYWGLGLEQLSEIPNRLTLGRQQAVNYSGYVGTENSGTGPQ
jgi:parallel beta-helix repeat protein